MLWFPAEFYKMQFSRMLCSLAAIAGKLQKTIRLLNINSKIIRNGIQPIQ